jgi:hypothetical protein
MFEPLGNTTVNELCVSERSAHRGFVSVSSVYRALILFVLCCGFVSHTGVSIDGYLRTPLLEWNAHDRWRMAASGRYVITSLDEYFSSMMLL